MHDGQKSRLLSTVDEDQPDEKAWIMDRPLHHQRDVMQELKCKPTRTESDTTEEEPESSRHEGTDDETTKDSSAPMNNESSLHHQSHTVDRFMKQDHVHVESSETKLGEIQEENIEKESRSKDSQCSPALSTSSSVQIDALDGRKDHPPLSPKPSYPPMMHPKIPHPFLPYLYYSGGFLPMGFPLPTEGISPGSSNDHGPSSLASKLSLAFPYFPGHGLKPPDAAAMISSSLASQHSNNSEAAPTLPHPLALAGYPSLWYQYYAALGQASNESVLASSSGMLPHSSTNTGPMLPSRNVNSRISPYPLSTLSKAPVNLPAPIPITPSMAKSREECNRSPVRRSPDSSSSPKRPGVISLVGHGTGSQLQNMQNMVHGLERQQQQIVTDSLTKLQA